MFPYADMEEDYWTGYFTSRANAKGFIRNGQSLLHASSFEFAKRMLRNTAPESEITAMLEAK